MNLPKIKSESFNNDVTLPSTGSIVTIRPYKVKEEKVLLMAAETKNIGQIFGSLVNLINECVVKPEGFKAESLTTFDMEYLFLQIRCLSVGESVPLKVLCEDESCDGETELVIDLQDIKIEGLDGMEPTRIIEITSDISIEISYPKLRTFIGKEELFSNESSPSQTYEAIEGCIQKVLTKDEVFIFHEASDAERKEFIDSLSPAHVAKIGKYFQTIPAVGAIKEFACSKCGKKQTMTMKGMQDFFS